MGRLTLWGMYQYDNSLFDDVVLPQGYDKNNLVNKIMADSGQLFPYYQVPPQLKINITRWFQTRFYDFQQMYKAYNAVYSPIENYDRTEVRNFKHQTDGTDTETNALGATHTTEYGSTDTNTYGRKDTTSYGNSETTNYGRKDDLNHGLQMTVTPDTVSVNEEMVSAYDSSSYSPRSQTSVTDTGNTTTVNSGTDTTQSSGNGTLTRSGSDSIERSGSDAVKRTGTDTVRDGGQDVKTTNYGMSYEDNENVNIHGNIGVTTNQQMITSELEMRMGYDLYAVISQMFEDEFIVQVY